MDETPFDVEIDLLRRAAGNLVTWKPDVRSAGSAVESLRRKIGAEIEALKTILAGETRATVEKIAADVWKAAENFQENYAGGEAVRYWKDRTPEGFYVALQLCASRLVALAEELRRRAGHIAPPPTRTAAEPKGLTPNEEAVLDALPPADSPMTGRDIVFKLARDGITNIDTKQLSRICNRKHMKKLGVRHRSRAGYYRIGPQNNP
jgi:hypothetical protein